MSAPKPYLPNVDRSFALIDACFALTEEYRSILSQIGMCSGLTENEMLVLVHLARNPEACTQKKLRGTHLQLSMSTICRMVESLRKKGFLTTELDENDRRSWIIHLEDRGRQLADVFDASLSQRVNELLLPMPGMDLERFVSVLSQAAEAAQAQSSSVHLPAV